MKSKSITVENSDKTEKRFRILNYLNIMLLVLAVPGGLIILFLICWDFSEFNSRASMFYPVVHYILFLCMQLLFFRRLIKLSDVKTKYIGKYKKVTVLKLFDTVIEENFDRGDEIPSIFIVEEVGSAAFVINSMLFNFIKQLNSITISKHLFEYLSIDEIKSIIAHEIGHFKKYLPIYNRVPYILFLIVVLLSYMSTVYLVDLVDQSVFIVYVICFCAIRYFINCVFNRVKKDVEYLSDLYSADKYGKLNAVNALIKIYQMDNMDIMMNIEVSKHVMQTDSLKIEDIYAITKKIRKKVGKRIYDENIIKNKIEECLENIKIGEKRKMSNRKIRKRNKELEEYVKNIEKMLKNKTLEWDEIDNHKKDGRIDLIEYKGLIRIIKENPELQLFRGPNDNVKNMKYEDHPTLRERIIYIDQNCSNI